MWDHYLTSFDDYLCSEIKVESSNFKLDLPIFHLVYLGLGFEKTIINKIMNQQINNDCITGQEIQELAKDLYEKRIKNEKILFS